MARPFKSVVSQTLHYFSRPHASVRREPIAAASDWRGSDFAGPEDWQETLEPEAIEEIERGLEVVRSTGKPLGALTAEDVPLPGLAPRFARWRLDLSPRGRGFVVLKGLPVERWSREDTERFYWCFGLHLGTPGAQNGKGELLGHVADDGSGADDTEVRSYRTTVDISYHCDAADVVGLLCLRPAISGGQSRIVSTVAVYNELLARAPHLVDRLYEPFVLDTRGDGGLRHFPVAPCRYSGGNLRIFYHSQYFRSAPRYPDVDPLTDDELELLDTFDAIAKELEVVMDLRAGDIQLLSNHTVAHGRTAYVDHEDPERKRHLLRLWLSLHHPEPLGDQVRSQLRPAGPHPDAGAEPALAGVTGSERYEAAAASSAPVGVPGGPARGRDDHPTVGGVASAQVSLARRRRGGRDLGCPRWRLARPDPGVRGSRARAARPARGIRGTALASQPRGSIVGRVGTPTAGPARARDDLHRGARGGGAMLMRLVGLPGDRLRFDKAEIHVNGAPVRELGSQMEVDVTTPWEPVEETVPSGEVFLLNDHVESVDSRHFVTIPADRVGGRYVPLGRTFDPVRPEAPEVADEEDLTFVRDHVSASPSRDKLEILVAQPDRNLNAVRIAG